MRIIHEYSANWTPKQAKVLKELGVIVAEGKSETIRLIENSDSFFNISSYLEKWGIYHIKGVKFSREEIINSDYSLISASKSIGYPMPDMDGSWLTNTYDLDNACSYCKIGKIQRSDFLLKKEPSLKNKIFTIGWVFDEFFVRKDIYDEIFEPLGISYRDVRLSDKSQSLVKNFVQLVIPVTKARMNLEDFEYEICKSCNVPLYHIRHLDFFPAQKQVEYPIYKSLEWFGSGASSRKAVFVNKYLKNILIEKNVMPWDFFHPCK